MKTVKTKKTRQFVTPHEATCHPVEPTVDCDSAPEPSPEPAPVAADPTGTKAAVEPAEKVTKKAKVKATKPAGRDAFGGRVGSRMSKINLVVINAGDKGAT